LRKVRILLLALAFLAAGLSQGFISYAKGEATEIYAGSGEAWYRDGTGPEAAFNQPYGLAVDSSGSIIVVDTYNNAVRRITDGKVVTITGYSDSTDSYGDAMGGFADGNVHVARFNRPRYAAVNSKGEIYVSDTGNHVIRVISGENVYTFAGSGKAGYADGEAGKARFNTPTGIALDKSGNLYVADSLNNVIRKITPKGQVSTFAGKYSEKGGYADGDAASALFNEPSDIAFDSKGALYVLDSGNQLVRKVYNGTVSTVAGVRGEFIEGTEYVRGGFANGKAAEARFNFPKGIDVTDDGVILIADTWNHRIRAINPDGSVVTVAGNGMPGMANGSLGASSFNAPVDVLAYGGKVYVSDMWNNCIRVFPKGEGPVQGVLDRDELIALIETVEKTGRPRVLFNSSWLEFPDEQPYAADGSVYLPLRFVCQAWGAEVRWLAGTKQVEVVRGDFRTVFTPGTDKTFFVGERTFIKAEDLMASTGLRVEWYPEHNVAVILD